MPVVSGDLKIVTNTPSRVTEVWVRAKGLRTHGSGVVLEEQDRKPVTGGHVSFEALAGPAVMVLVRAGQPMEAVGLIVPDSPTATLADCVRNAEMAGDRDVSELAGILEQIRASVGASAEARAGAEAAAEDAAGSAVSAGRDADRAEAAAGEAATEAAGLAADAVRLEVKEDADRSAAGATTATEKAAEAAGSATRAEAAEAGAVTARTGAEAGQELSEVAAALAITVAATVTQYVGEGFPEGKVTAPVGAIYTDRLATAGAIRWIKTSGSGSTGWKVEYGDTGWIDVRDSLLNGWTASGAQIRRINAQVFVKMFNLRGGDATDRRFLPLPEGFNWGGSGNQMVIGEVPARYFPHERALALDTGLDYFGQTYHEGNLTIDRDWPISLHDLTGDGGGGAGPDPADGPEESPAGSGLYTTTGIAENPAGSGLFDIPTSLTPDPDNPGLYLIGV